MKNHHREFVHLRVVPSQEQPRIVQGSALVFGPFPPLANPTATHASTVLHLLKSIGYTVTTATGPGLALAGHQLNFTSSGRFENSAAFLSDAEQPDVSVFYARTAEFSRISKPLWYRRRLEELRRLKFLMRIIDRSRKTCLVLDEMPLTRRDSFCFWALGLFWAKLRGKPLQIVRNTTPEDQIVDGLTGQRKTVPPAYLAEATAYEAAFNTLGPDSTVRLTCIRSQQCAQSWAAKAPAEQTGPTLADLDLLVSVFRRHDLRILPQFKLMWQGTEGFQSSPVQSNNRSFLNACERDPEHAEFGLPITRYMTHLRAVLNKQKEFPLTNKAEARKFLNWALWEAGENTPAKRMPITDDLCNFVVSGSKSFGPLEIHRNPAIGSTLARNPAPFPLPSDLLAILASDQRLNATYDVHDPIDRVGFALEVLLRLPADADPYEVLGVHACNWFAQAIGGNGMCLSRLEYIIALTARFELSGAAAAERPWEEDKIRQWIQNSASQVFPAIKKISAIRPSRISPRKTLAITGLPRSQTGVGSNLRMSFDAFRKLGISPVVRDAADELKKVELAPQLELGRSLRKHVNLHHLNADTIPQTLVAPPIAGTKDAYNVGFLLWEFDVLPKTHHLALDMLDEVWVPSQFLRDTYKAATNIPVHNVLKGINIPRVAPVRLSDFGASIDKRTYLTCFDFHSSVARKNPMAAVRAFLDAFPLSANKDVQLIIKTTPVQDRHWGDPENQMAQIRAAVAADPRLVLIAEQLPFHRLLGLIAACDCLLSPHRAEGFGLMPAYALAFKRPVIATDYSGTTDFCTDQTATVLPYQLVDVEPNQVLHPMKGAKWANIDHDAFVAALRELQDRPGLAMKKALRGAKLMRTRYSPDRQADRYLKRLKSIDALL